MENKCETCGAWKDETCTEKNQCLHGTAWRPVMAGQEILEKLKEIKLLSLCHDGTYTLRDVVLERLNALIQQLER